MAKTINFVSEVLDREFTYEIPFRITCNVSGLVKTYTLESYINRKIDRFGGLEKLYSKYVCKDAKKLLKEGMTPEEVKMKLNPPKEEEVKIEDPVMEEIQEVVEERIEEVIVTPLAKKDKNGKYRNLKGHLIPEMELENYALMD